MKSRRSGADSRLALTAALFAFASAAHSQPTINLVDLTTRSVSFQCLDYNPLAGMCVWLDCSPFGCSIVTVPKVRHRIPDVVVSAYHETGENPWLEARPLVRALKGSLEGGLTAEAAALQHTNLRFKNVDAIGNPLVTLLGGEFVQSGLMCPSSARPFVPYFVSTLDTIAWRFGIPESVFPQALLPGMREVSGALAPLGTWGSLYPRSGFIIQTHDYKAAAVTAQRTANVITQRGQPHVYRPVVVDPRDGYWPPGEAIENDATTAVWQELFPEPSNTCHVFAEVDDRGEGIGDPYAERLSEHGDYVWNLWRPYACCEGAGDVLLFSIDF